ncbi:hypothetical protein P175DRAFT_0548012 [Aspergillus ochraceoroseus IBT 24754]|uniref:Zn(2)-C6 fungal-type domain-containing protein n=1 Tax=Aspergillus ochraceoroseus IBT 24754 TaxID=1392256 RepID=A0A2T5LUM6_9EURO|nr:uncharacterized protein P175DRAFT_0548012 [Aspergillus ochraceoroseus IBT 24754]PTU19984.1 hypothetical protein P175DRAFT_0548012 [Aspergillus ochraceoroseus IBT 24754]
MAAIPNPDGEYGISPERLPKSVKIRSTCNACQQAKIRCSHERPSCRRCQKHNIDCIYSISRRLGRPAKKKDIALNDSSVGQECNESPGSPLNKRSRCPKKRKAKEETMNEHMAREDPVLPTEKLSSDYMVFGSGHMNDLSVEDTNMQSPILADIATTAPFSLSDNVDITSESWLQEFMSNPFTDPALERSFFEPFAADETKVDNGDAALTMEAKDPPPTYPESFSDSASEMQEPPLSSTYFSATSGCLAHNDDGAGRTQGALPGNPAYPEYLMKETGAWAQPLSTIGEGFPPDSSCLFPQMKTSKRTCDFKIFGDDFSVNPNSLVADNFQCQAHEQAVRDLIRINVCASYTGPSAAIDSILTCQKALQQLAETILQCRICSRARVNVLMVVVVSIDSLITTLETITSVENDLVGRMFPEFYNPLLHDYRSDAELATHSRRYKGSSPQLRVQLDSCPLVIGDFYVSSDEKFLFVKRVLHSRLSSLLGTVRRIRLCTQEALAVSASRGRLVMMMETDRRLQLIMMKLKMLSKP